MGVLARIFGRGAVKAAEGGNRPEPYLLPDGWLSAKAGKSWNWWQMGHSLSGDSSRSATVRACVSAYSQTAAMCPGTHWRSTGDGGRKRVANSALTRIHATPNKYQSISDFYLNLGARLLEHGNAYALALRNNRFEISEVHLMGSRESFPRIAASGDVFYALGGNEIVDRRLGAENLAAVPARDVLHLRLLTPRHPLKGEPPLTAAMLDGALSDLMMARALSLASKDGRPPGVVESDLILSKEQIDMLREKMNEVFGADDTPILMGGLKWKSTMPTSRDAQIAELLQMSDQRIASVYRVPLPISGLAGGQLPNSSTEALMQFWVATGLGFFLNHIEEGMGQLFGLAGFPNEYLELDTKALLRSSFKDRIDGLARGVQGGVFSPNEARAEEELPETPFGDEPRVQQQVVPLSAWAQMPPQTPRPDAPAAPPPAPSDAADAALSRAIVAQQWKKQILDAANRFDRSAA